MGQHEFRSLEAGAHEVGFLQFSPGRVYREAWNQADALALLRREAGTGFDPRCVEALERVLSREARDPGLAPEPKGDGGDEPRRARGSGKALVTGFT